MKVLHALTTAMPGGTETSVLRLLPHLESKGIQGVVTVLRRGGPMIERFEAAGIRVYRLGAEHGLRHAWRRVLDVLRQERVEIVHAYGFSMSVLARLAVRHARPRPALAIGIRGLHLTDDENASGIQAMTARAIERRLGGLVDRYIANSDSAVDFLVSKRFPPEKFIVVGNGIDVADWPAGGERPDPLVLCVAGLRPVKRVDHLLDALAALHRRHVEFRCAIAGDGVLRRSLEQRSASLGLERHVHFQGRVDERGIREWLRTCRVLALPSFSEGMPVSVMEAMASGVPVVACDIPGVRDLVVHEVTGLLVPPRDTDAMARAIEALLTDSARAERLGAAGRQRIVRHFSLDAHVEGHAAAYGRIAREAGADPAAAALEAGGGGR